YCFFQAEDGIRDDLVTGVQTCALPILEEGAFTGNSDSNKWRLDCSVTGEEAKYETIRVHYGGHAICCRYSSIRTAHDAGRRDQRSEERRVGKECRGTREQSQ